MGRAIFDRMPGIAGVITGGIKKGVIIKRAVSNGADFLELRVDTFRDLNSVSLIEYIKKLKSFKELSDIPIILTVRSSKEGGAANLSDEARLLVFDALMPFIDIVDIELSSGRILKNVINSARRQGKKTIISYHNFGSTPPAKALEGIIEKSKSSGADIVKIATTAKDRGDLKRLAKILLNFNNLIVIAMGGAGAPSRVFFPMLGSLLTYGSITGHTAPGQPTIAQLKKQFRFYGLSPAF